MERVRTPDTASFTIDRLVAGPLETNVLILRDVPTGATVIVDAADDAGLLEEAVADLDVRAILTTHGHWDHHQAAPELADRLDVPVLMHRDDRAITDLEALPLEPGSFALGDTRIAVVHTPGHTPGSVSLLLEGIAITGDTLFPGGPGATRFPYSDFDRIIESIRAELFTLPDDTTVIPGHGATTTVGNERPHLQDWIDRRW